MNRMRLIQGMTELDNLYVLLFPTSRQEQKSEQYRNAHTRDGERPGSMLSIPAMHDEQLVRVTHPASTG